ncbi:MAG: extradiol ring-cleavage dioxygenase [Chloroflexota bacterium]|nr:extradiol ring-cleavage dioxygenase [Chloroflexota bacterium]
MADIVLGIGTSHTPQISTPWEHWPDLGKTQEVSPAIPENLEEQLDPKVHERKHAAVQQAVKKLGDVLQSAKGLDAIVIFGDDQHEQFRDENMPAVAIYHGETFSIKPRPHNPNAPAWMEYERKGWENTRTDYPNAVGLANHLIESLTEQEFEVSRCSQLREGQGIGHAFSFLYRRLWPDCEVPIVPVMLNTYYPPNQPTPKRCYALGQAVREAVQEWKGGDRVAIIASGGLSHIVIDEPLDYQVIDALRAHDRVKLAALPRDKMRGGTSEILNWVALAGAVGPLDMTLVDYIPGYRSKPSTGCAMTFAQWN